MYFSRYTATVIVLSTIHYSYSPECHLTDLCCFVGQSVGPAADFYQSALQYLAYTPIDSIPKEEK